MAARPPSWFGGTLKWVKWFSSIFPVLPDTSIPAWVWLPLIPSLADYPCVATTPIRKPTGELGWFRKKGQEVSGIAAANKEMGNGGPTAVHDGFQGEGGAGRGGRSRELRCRIRCRGGRVTAMGRVDKAGALAHLCLGSTASAQRDETNRKLVA